MPRHEVANRIHKAVLWPVIGRDRHGKPTYGPPESLDVRWVETRREVSDNQGRSVMVDATAVVDRDIAEGSRMWLGRIEDLPPTQDFSQEVQGTMEVVGLDKAPDYKGRVMYREVMLARHSHKAP